MNTQEQHTVDVSTVNPDIPLSLLTTGHLCDLA